jgi:hypothetical protein
VNLSGAREFGFCPGMKVGVAGPRELIHVV